MSNTHFTKAILKRAALWAAVTGAFAWAASAAEVDVSKLPPPAKKKISYAQDIKPIIEKSCLKCHGPEKPKAKLRLDSRAAILKGSEDGPVVVEGNSAKSKLIHAVARLDEDSAMPPEGKADPLTKEQVGLLRAWIDQGLKWDEAAGQ